MDEKIKELIDLYDKVINGSNNSIGMTDCLDPYYFGCWEKELDKIDSLREEIFNNLNLNK